MTALPHQPASHESRRSRARPLFILLSVVAIFAVSCATVDRMVIAPPQIPGATYVGTETCSTCHEEQVKEFKTATHSRLQAKGANAENMGCESCHGPGSLHAEAGGGKNTLTKTNIVNPGKKPEVCFQCHLDKRADFSLPHSHPVLAGKMSCTDCHDPHKGSAVKGGGTALHSENETCFRCHAAQKGPFVFEHEALREGCTTCHKPHGSVNPKMLTERNANLCLKCHIQQVSDGQIWVGGGNHTARLSQGTCFSYDCHEAVHGSQQNSSLRR